MVQQYDENTDENPECYSPDLELPAGEIEKEVNRGPEYDPYADYTSGTREEYERQNTPPQDYEYEQTEEPSSSDEYDQSN